MGSVGVRVRGRARYYKAVFTYEKDGNTGKNEYGTIMAGKRNDVSGIPAILVNFRGAGTTAYSDGERAQILRAGWWGH